MPSVMDTFTLNVPGIEYTCVGDAPEPEVPSPKSHVMVSASPSVSLPPILNATSCPTFAGLGNAVACDCIVGTGLPAPEGITNSVMLCDGAVVVSFPNITATSGSCVMTLAAVNCHALADVPAVKLAMSIS